MGAMLVRILQWFGAGSVKNALIGSGFGVASSLFISTLISSFIQKSLTSFSSLSGTVAAYIGLSGFDVYLSIVVGALIMKATIASLSLSIVKKS